MNKKLITIFIILTSTISLISVMVLGFYTTGFSFGDNSTTLYLEGNSVINDKNEFYNQIKYKADKYDLNIYKIYYSQVKKNEKNKVIMYAYINNEQSFYNNIQLKSGRYLNKNDTDNYYLTTKQNNDSNCVGIMKWFDGTAEVEVRPITACNNDLMNGHYTIGTQDTTITNAFINDLKGTNNEYNINISTDAERIAIIDSVITKFMLVYIFTLVTFGLGLLSIIMFIYNLVFNFKHYSIKKLNGFNNKKIIFSIYKMLVGSYFIATLTSYCITIIGLCFYNNLSFLFDYLKILSLIYISVFILIFIIISIITPILIKKINLSNMIKNKKPINLIRILNSSSKLILSICTIVVMSLLLQNIITLVNQNNELKRWEFTKNYAFMRVNLAQGDSDEEYLDFHQKCKSFFKITNEKGGILMEPSDALLSKEIAEKENNNYPQWHYYLNSVNINNNYLKENPIYDINGNRLLFENEQAEVYNILIPEKFQSDNEKIVKNYNDHKDFLLRGFEQNGSQNVSINIIYVKNNQKYFSMNPTCGIDKGFNYVDPIAIVFNSVNTSEDMASANITQGHYYPKIDNIDDPLQSLTDALNESRLGVNLLTAPSLYNYVSTEFYNNARLAGIYTILTIITLLMFLVIILVSIINYMDHNKVILAVEKIHGFSYISRHISIYIKSLIMWGMLLSISTIFFSSYNAQYVTLALALLDIIIKTVLIKIKELKNTRDILKGE